MRFINVTDEQYELINKIATESECTVPEVVEDLLQALRHFVVLSFKQDIALRMAKELLCEENEDGEKESEGDI